MKIVFLDIDGVLNSDDWYKSGEAKKAYEKTKIVSDYHFDPSAWSLVEKLLIETGAKIVLSSSWRNFTLESTLKDFTGTKFEVLNKYIVGITPRSRLRNRGKEIETFIKNTDIKIDKYVIIDDDTDFNTEQLPYFVRTDWFQGITEENYNKAKKILNNE